MSSKEGKIILAKDVIKKKYGTDTWRVRLPLNIGYVSVLVKPYKKYGDKYGHELIEEHKSKVEPKTI